MMMLYLNQRHLQPPGKLQCQSGRVKIGMQVADNRINAGNLFKSVCDALIDFRSVDISSNS